MRTVLHVIDTTGPGGAETVYVELADRLRGVGYRSVALLRGKGWVYEELRRRGLEPVLLDAKGSFNWRYLLALRRLIRDEKVDVIQSHLLGSNVYCACAGWLTGTPVVATFHGAVDISAVERYRRLKLSIMQRGVRRYVTVSQSLRDTVARGKLLDPRRTSVIYNGIDVKQFARPRHRDLCEQLVLPKQAVLIGALGNVRPAKAYDVLIRAAAQICARHPTVHFVIAGHIKPSVMAPLEGMLGALKLESRVHFLGYREDAAHFLAGLDMFVLSSISEGFSIATIQAQAAGLPVVATRSGGPEEIVTDGQTGILVAPGDADALAAGIERYLDDQGRAGESGVAAKTHVTRRFGVDGMVAAYAELYRAPGLLHSRLRQGAD